MTYLNEGKTPFSLGDLKVPRREARNMNKRYYGLGFSVHHPACGYCGRKACKGTCRKATEAK